MFGCLVAGRLVQTNPQTIDDTHAIFPLPNATTNSINHVCVFLLGTIPFPEGYGATVHLHWPGRGFQLLGMLSNDKPSSIFRLRASAFTSSTTTRAFSTQNEEMAIETDPSNPPEGDGDTTAILGISVEPLDQIYAQIQSLPPSNLNPNPNYDQSSVNAMSSSAVVRPPPDPTLLAERIVRHLFNYLSGFASSSSGSPGPGTTVPMSLIAKWYEVFVSKVKNTGALAFLEREE
ncbi:DUF775-domain-containing protein [Gymnopus androsaceus JB14]|uniref:DUF775-domain-containing protein n=1 Tax=Gymnopus androsaceus JB14 TaxID=1447944 RepID=A0A6A4GWW9_9AGAR|nr:DUF775-domain-containing protein [Gymnopus androsaceus JB14]